MPLQTYSINLNPKRCPFGCFLFFFRWSSVITEWLWTNSPSLWPTLDFLFPSSAWVSHSFTGCCSGEHYALKPTLSGTFRLSISLELVAGICPSSTLGVKMLCLGLKNRAFCMRFRVGKLAENFNFGVLGPIVYVGARCAALCPLSKQVSLILVSESSIRVY
jgi:hypothetical protein